MLLRINSKLLLVTRYLWRNSSSDNYGISVLTLLLLGGLDSCSNLC
jgi:hypothetical protein